jgi:ankyrin repeat protein
MKFKSWILALTLALAAIAHGATNGLTALLQKGLFEEEANRDLSAAIANYQSLASAFDKDRQLAATAIFRLGECYRKLGKTGEAAVQYQRIIKEFSDQQTLVILSRQNLAGLGVSDSPARTSVSEVSSRASETLQQELERSDAKTIKNRALLATLKGMDHAKLRKALPELIPDAQLDALETRLNEAMENLIKLKKDYSADHPNYKNAQEVIEALNQKIDDRIKAIIDGLEAQDDAESYYHDSLMQILNQRRDFVSGTAEQLAADRAKLAQMLTTYLPDNSKVVELQKKIDLEAAALKELGGKDPNAQGSNTSAQSATTDEEQTQIRNIQAMIQNSPDLINATSAANGNETPLQVAATKGQLVVAKYLLDHGADVNRKAQNGGGDPGGTPLYLAAAHGHKAMVELLLSRGADVNGVLGFNPLYAAVSRGFTGVADVLLSNKADVNPVAGDNGKRPLHIAVLNDKTNLLQSLIEHGADVNATDFRSNAPLHFAASGNRFEAVKMLLAAKADVNARDKEGNAPLHLAASQGYEKIISLLLDSGASVDATNYNLGTPLYFAVSSRRSEAVRILLAHKADLNLNSRLRPNDPPIAYAIGPAYSPGILQMLLEAGANANSDTNSWYRPIFSALGKDHLEGLKLLLQHHADPNAKSDEGLTPLFLTTEPDIVRLLIDYKADLNARDSIGLTPIMRVTGAAATNFIKILLDTGAKTDLQDTNGNTALHYAVYRVDPESVATLLEHKADPNIQNDQGFTPLDLAKAGNAVRDSMLVANGGFGRGRRPNSGQLIGSGLLVNPSSGNRPLSDMEQKIVDLLVNAGGLANLPKRDRIEARRANTAITLSKDFHGRNRYSLLELISKVYGLLSQNSFGEWRPQIAKMDSRQNLFNDTWRFPDFKNVVIYRRTNASEKQTVIKVDVDEILKTGDCSRDRWLEWGDIVEVPEADHPVDQTWPGLSDEDGAALIKCVSREAALKIKGESTTLKLAPELKPTQIPIGDMIFAGTRLTSASFMLRSALDNSKLIRVSSDLSHVKVTRIDPETKKKVEWVVDCTDRAQSDLWLRDGDVIEVPEK